MRGLVIRSGALAMGLLLAMSAHGGDCYNDDVPARSDLEPPIPGSSADLLRVSEEDVQRMLDAIRAYEQRHASAPSAASPAATSR